MVRIAVAQTLTDRNDPAANVARAVTYIKEAAAREAVLLLLPETYPGPWTPPLGYDALPALAAAAREHGIHVAAGMIEPAGAPERYYTSHCLIDDRGELVGTYRRTTPAGPWLYQGSSFWDFHWQEADEFPVFDTPWAKVGIAICSEVYIPEVSRALALQGAEIILLPAGVPKGSLWATWRTLIFARAIENLCITATCQNLFEPTDQGLAMVCSPEAILLEAAEPGLFVADCDLERLRLLRATPDSWEFAGDRACKPGIFRQWYRPAPRKTASARPPKSRLFATVSPGTTGWGPGWAWRRGRASTFWVATWLRICRR
jgi:predicted amidohydrolase